MIDLKRSTLALAFLLASAGASAVQVPRRLNIQGKLLDASGAPRNGNVAVRFSLYAAPSGGASLYDEPSSGGFMNALAVNGAFSVSIGTITGLVVDLFSGTSAYLGITVSGDAEMTPRIPLTASGYAFTAMQLVSSGDIRLNAGVSYATFTAAGYLAVPSGVVATTGTFTGPLTASSGTFTGGYGVDVGYGVIAGSATIGSGVTASSGTFLATGPTQYSVETSSGINVRAGTLFVEGSGGVTVTNNLKAANFSNELLFSTELGAAAATIDTGTFPGRKHLMVVIESTGTTAAALFQLQFNGDTTASRYISQSSDDNTGATTAVGTVAQIRLQEITSALPRIFNVEIDNNPAALHTMIFYGAVDAGVGVATRFTEGSGVYTDTTQITRIVLSLSAAGNLMQGTRLTVFGTND